MKRLIFLATLFAAVLALVVPFLTGGGLAGTAQAVTEAGAAATRTITTIEAPAAESVSPASATPVASGYAVSGAPSGTAAGSATSGGAAAVSAGSSSPQPGTFAVETGSGCPQPVATSTSGAPSATSGQGVAGTTTTDLEEFARKYNAIRLANCLPPVTTFVYDSCMEARLFWMAESPSSDPLDAWGHMGSVRIDGVPSVGCDGNLAGGSNNTGATVAQKWWDSAPHRASLYRPGYSVGGVCIAFAMTHGGIDEPTSFVRSAARWVTCP